MPPAFQLLEAHQYQSSQYRAQLTVMPSRLARWTLSRARRTVDGSHSPAQRSDEYRCLTSLPNELLSSPWSMPWTINPSISAVSKRFYHIATQSLLSRYDISPTFDCVTLTPRDRRNKAFSAKTADDWIGLDWTAEAWVCKDNCMLADNIKATWNEAHEPNTVPSARAGKIGHSESFRLPIARLSPLSSVGFNRFPDRFAISLGTAGLPAVN
ncbi:hypothetical protein B0H13DRAFT_2264416 [Mycena leptocephala]|nr:hypothetical protein B0H13DRAFT_2264416 [Mycena leptocephala]